MRLAAYAVLFTFTLGTLRAYAEEETTIQQGDAVGMTQSDQTHTVVPGDTLWDLTAKYLQNPWYWPKVWSYNPQLTNPHFIYPGQLVRFFPSNEQLPARIEASAQRDMPGEEGAASQGNQDEDNGQTEVAEDSTQKKQRQKMDAVSVAGNRPLVYNAGRGMVVQNLQLVTKKELKDAGELTHAVDDKKLLSNYDVAFVKWSKTATEQPQAGQPLIIFKTLDEVEHPVSGKTYGYLTQITASAEIVEVPENLKKELVTIRILKAYEPVERGQLIAAQKGPLLTEITETPNNKKLDGVVLTGGVYTTSLLGQFHYVFVDRGTNDGVVNGNQFAVIRDRDLFKDGDKIPKQTVGKLVVIDAKETASLALVTRSLRDIAPGDMVQMRDK